MQPDFDIDDEIQARLHKYHELLKKWQPKINIVSKQQVSGEYWQRHFIDSLQLLPILNKQASTLVGLGSGGGFPGLVLAIATNLRATFIESDQRKCSFLRTVSRETNTSTQVLNMRIEDAVGSVGCPDIITARALASLEKLMAYCLVLWDEGDVRRCQLIFMKGERWQEEVNLAKQIYDFDLRSHQSLTHKDAQILEISNLCKK